MKKFTTGNFSLVFYTCLRTLLILLTFLPAVCCQGQEHLSVRTHSSITRDTLQMRDHLKAAQNREISPDSALKILSKALSLSKKNGLKKKQGVIWNMMGNRMLQKRNFIDCQHYLDSAFALNEQLKDPELTLLLNTLAAHMYQFSANYAKAASHYFRAIQVVPENVNSPRSVANLYHRLGSLMLTLDEDSLANYYLLHAKQYVLKIQPVDSIFLLNVLMTLAQADVTIDSKAAIGYYKDVYTMAKKLDYTSLYYMILINLTSNYAKNGQYDSAEHYLHLARSADDFNEMQEKSEAIAGILAFEKKDYTNSLTHLQNAMALIDNEEDGRLEGVYEVFMEVYAARGEYRKAYEYQKKYIEQHNKSNDDKSKIIADFMLNFQALENEKTVLQKQAEISSKEAAIKKQRFWIATMGLASVMLFVILIMAYRNYHHKRSLLSQQMHALLQDQEIERLKAEAEGADNERTRIAYDLHDGVMVRLANVKINLNSLPVTHPEVLVDARFSDIVTQLDTAAGELRNTAHNLMPEILLEDGVAQAIFYFCKTTEQASGSNIKFQQIGQLLPRLQIQVEAAVYRIVQGLVQNVIQHAKATTALVQLQYAEHFCSITVEDNGQGISQDAGHEGYGLKSIRNRVKILNGTFDIKSDKTAGTTAYLEFDVLPFLRKET